MGQKYPQTIELETSHGPAEAIKQEQDAPWHIGYPWGDDTFYGSKPEAEAQMRSVIDLHDEEEAQPILSEAQVEAACDWWAKAVVNPKMDNGGQFGAWGMAAVLALMTTQKNVDESMVDKFKEALRKRLRILTKNDFFHSIYVDYGPDLLLGGAMEEAGISGRNAPWKTCMWFRDGGVQVSHGYGAETQDILPKTVVEEASDAKT